MPARALTVAYQDPPGVSPDEAVVELSGVLNSIGDTCPSACPRLSKSNQL